MNAWSGGTTTDMVCPRCAEMDTHCKDHGSTALNPSLPVQYALGYAQLGRPVFPCIETPGEKAKSPYTKNGFHDATTDSDQIKRWWTQHPRALIGGPVALDETCLDTDPRKAGDIEALLEWAGLVELPRTRTVISGRYDGGAHYFFTRPEGDYTGAQTRLPAGVDLKDGGKGYTILPPSIHPDTGGQYFYSGCSSPAAAPLPIEIHQKLLKPERPVEPFAEFTTDPFGANGKKNTPAALAGITRTIANAQEGERNRTLYWGARRIVENQHPVAAWDEVRRAARHCGLDDTEIDRTIRSAKAGSDG